MGRPVLIWSLLAACTSCAITCVQEKDVLAHLHVMCGKSSHVELPANAGKRAPPKHCSLIGAVQIR
jgi:hypothetical protein